MTSTPEIKMRPFGQTRDGKEVTSFTLDNGRGLRADILDYGGTVTRLFTPDRRGRSSDVVLGFDNIAQYETESPYFGCIVGRYGNRIANGQFRLGKRTYQLARNNGTNNLHGGVRGFNKVVWDAVPFIEDGEPALALGHLSPDGDEGFPGNLQVTVVYSLTRRNALRIEYTATTDKATPVNLTHHGYFNLKGEGRGDILDHEAKLMADQFTAVNDHLIPTGELRPVKGTPMDFTRPHRIGERIGSNDEQIRLGGGYDHNFVLRGGEGKLRRAAVVRERKSGRTLELWTTDVGVQFYTGNFLNGKVGKSARPYHHRDGFCLECQHFPDSPNQPAFPSTILRKGDLYHKVTEYRFSAK